MRLIDADKYSDDMKERQEKTLQWMDRTAYAAEQRYTIHDVAKQSFLTFAEAKLTLDKQPTVDIVTVVHCKDCKKLERDGYCRSIGKWIHKKDFYCADGEGKTDETGER